MSEPRRIYLGDKPLAYAAKGNNSFYTPIFTIFTILTGLSAFEQLTVLNAGITALNGDWFLATGTVPNAGIKWNNPKLTGTVTTRPYIYFNTTRNRFEFRYAPLTSTFVYFTTSYTNSSIDVPLTGWQSGNSAWNPPPTIVYNTALPLSSITISTIAPVQLPLSSYFQVNDTFYGYTSSTIYDQITSVNLGSKTTSINANAFYNLKELSYANNSPNNIVVKNHNNIESLTVGSLTNNGNITILNNSNLKTIGLNFGNSVNESNFILANCPSVENLTINATNLRNFDINFSKLQRAFIQQAPLTSLQLTNISSLSTLWIDNNELSGFEIVDTLINNRINSRYVNSKNKGKLGRSSASTTTLYSTVTASEGPVIQIEIDPLYPKYQVPEDIYTTTLPGSSLIVTSPVSGNQAIPHPLLSGIYEMVPNVIKDNRSVFKNINDYYILYSKNQDLWTLVGPTSTSDVIWLSAVGGAGDWENVPNSGWSGPAFGDPGFWNSGRFWWNGTRVFSTSQLFVTGMKLVNESPGLRLFMGPLTGTNNNFYWKHLDFSGRGWTGTVDSPVTPTVVLISPIHFVCNTHFPVSINTSVNFINKDGTIETRTCLSSVNLSPIYGNGYVDQTIGILNAPVSATSYRLMNGNPGSLIRSPESFKNFLYGPSQYGLVGYPYVKSTSNLLYMNTISDFASQTYSVPKSLWHGDLLTGGDSSTPCWYINNNELILLSLTQFSNGDGPHYGNNTSYPNRIQTYNHMITSLSLQFFGSNTNYYTVSSYEL
jgi:hypothetical protein